MFDFLKGLFSHTRKGNKKQINSSSLNNNLLEKITFDKNLVTINYDNESWFGAYSRSPNRRYTIAWRDNDYDGHKGGGSYVVIEDSKIILKGTLERPSDGNIANNGVFILHDQLYGNGLKGIFYAFNIQGEILVKHLVDANLDMYNNKLSTDGTRATFKTCSNPNSDDGNKVFTYDIENKKLLRKSARRITKNK